MVSAVGIASPMTTAVPATATAGFPEAYAEMGGTLIAAGGERTDDRPPDEISWCPALRFREDPPFLLFLTTRAALSATATTGLLEEEIRGIMVVGAGAAGGGEDIDNCSIDETRCSASSF